MRSRDIENRNQLHSALRKLEAERNQQHGLIERAQKESKKLEQENESLCQKMKAV